MKKGFTALQCPYFMSKDVMAKTAQLEDFEYVSSIGTVRNGLLTKNKASNYTRCLTAKTKSTSLRVSLGANLPWVAKCLVWPKSY